MKRLAELKGIQQAFQMYEGDSGQVPGALADLVQTGILPPAFIKDYVEVSSPRRYIYLSRPFPAVRKGEPWGGPGDTAETDIPEGRLIWVVGENPKIMDENAFQQNKCSFTE